MNAAALFVQPPASSVTVPASNNSADVKVYEHPQLMKIISDLTSEFSNYKYTVYRCSSKLVALQKKLFTSKISYKLVEAILTSRHGINTDSGCNLMILPYQLTSLIHDNYFACESLGHFKGVNEYSLEQATSVLSNFFWNVFDPHRRHSISLLEVKVTFILLCKLPNNEELILEFYKLIYDRKSKYVSKFYFEYLLNTFTKILSYIGEGDAYGAQNVPKAIEQIYSRCHNPMGLTEQQFNNLWSTTQTRFLIYANLIVTIKRMEYTEKIVHNNPCISCGLEKIVGIRFKCRTCKNLSLCLKCFAIGYNNNKHQSGHRVYEMFHEDEPNKKVSHFFAKLCNGFFTKTNNVDCDEEVKGFCNVNENITPTETELVTIPTNETKDNHQNKKNENNPEYVLHKVRTEPSLLDLSKTASNASDVSARLQSIIDRLLVQNFKIEQYLKFVPTASPEQISEFLKSHQKFLTDIIKEMREFKSISSSNGTMFPTSSTPNHSGGLNKALLLENSNMSTLGINLTHSIYGADINRSYLEANKSDYSLNDISVWFNQRKIVPYQTTKSHLDTLPECQQHNDVELPLSSYGLMDARETEMSNFRLLLHKVKEIVDDSYSDNTELAAATQNLENVLDTIIKSEESRRCSVVDKSTMCVKKF